ncbi:unnamed protein product [Phyllotreta striolata]|uniref:Uncharacterized protein n=1 Tax=Phyllotreta striolata TaxID=444603 RepID=A0A9N9TJJ8_PHYSR|nr:unnamed protein product [Phyllotreta striolata]
MLRNILKISGLHLKFVVVKNCSFWKHHFLRKFMKIESTDIGITMSHTIPKIPRKLTNITSKQNISEMFLNSSHSIRRCRTKRFNPILKNELTKPKSLDLANTITKKRRRIFDRTLEKFFNRKQIPTAPSLLSSFDKLLDTKSVANISVSKSKSLPIFNKLSLQKSQSKLDKIMQQNSFIALKRQVNSSKVSLNGTLRIHEPLTSFYYIPRACRLNDEDSSIDFRSFQSKPNSFSMFPKRFYSTQAAAMSENLQEFKQEFIQYLYQQENEIDRAAVLDKLDLLLAQTAELNRNMHDIDDNTSKCKLNPDANKPAARIMLIDASYRNNPNGNISMTTILNSPIRVGNFPNNKDTKEMSFVSAKGKECSTKASNIEGDGFMSKIHLLLNYLKGIAGSKPARSYCTYSLTTGRILGNKDIGKIPTRRYHVLTKLQGKKLTEKANYTDLRQLKGDATETENIRSIQGKVDNFYKWHKLNNTHNVQLTLKRSMSTNKSNEINTNEYIDDNISTDKSTDSKATISKKLTLNDVLNMENWKIYQLKKKYFPASKSEPTESPDIYDDQKFKNELFIPESKYEYEEFQDSDRPIIDDDEVSVSSDGDSVHSTDTTIQPNPLLNNAILKKIVKYFQARPVPSAEEFKRRYYKEKARHYARLAGLVMHETRLENTEIRTEFKPQERFYSSSVPERKTFAGNFLSRFNLHKRSFSTLGRHHLFQPDLHEQIATITKDFIRNKVEDTINSSKSLFDPESTSVCSKESTDSFDKLSEKETTPENLSNKSPTNPHTITKIIGSKENLLRYLMQKAVTCLNKQNYRQFDKLLMANKKRNVEDIHKILEEINKILEERDQQQICDKFIQSIFDSSVVEEKSEGKGNVNKTITTKTTLPEIIFDESKVDNEKYFKAVCLMTFMHIFRKTEAAADDNYEDSEKLKTKNLIKKLNKILGEETKED